MITLICCIFGVVAPLIICFLVMFGDDLTKMCLEPKIRMLEQLEYQLMVIRSYRWKSGVVRDHRVQIREIIQKIREDRWGDFTSNKYVYVLIEEVEKILDEPYEDDGYTQKSLQNLDSYDEKLVKYAAKLSYQLYRVGYRVGTPSYEVRPDDDENIMYFDFDVGYDYEYLDSIDYEDPEKYDPDSCHPHSDDEDDDLWG